MIHGPANSLDILEKRILTSHATSPVPRHETSLTSPPILGSPHPAPARVTASYLHLGLERPKVAPLSRSCHISATLLGQTFPVQDVVAWTGSVVDVHLADTT